MAVTAAAAEVYSLEAKAESLAGFLQSWKSGSCKHLPAPSWPSTAPEETKTKKTICAGNNAMEFRFGFTLKSKCGYNFQAHTHKRQESRQRLLGCGEEPASVLKRAVGYTKVVGKQKYRCFQANGPILFGLNHHGLQTTRNTPKAIPPAHVCGTLSGVGCAWPPFQPRPTRAPRR